MLICHKSLKVLLKFNISKSDILKILNKRDCGLDKKLICGKEVFKN